MNHTQNFWNHFRSATQGKQTAELVHLIHHILNSSEFIQETRNIEFAQTSLCSYENIEQGATSIRFDVDLHNEKLGGPNYNVLIRVDIGDNKAYVEIAQAGNALGNSWHGLEDFMRFNDDTEEDEDDC
jgi:hypothetical protein